MRKIQQAGGPESPLKHAPRHTPIRTTIVTSCFVFLTEQKARFVVHDLRHLKMLDVSNQRGNMKSIVRPMEAYMSLLSRRSQGSLSVVAQAARRL